MLTSTLLDAIEPRAQRHPLYGVDGHHCSRNIRIQSIKNRFAQAWRNPLGANPEPRTDRIAFSTEGVDKLGNLIEFCIVGKKEWIVRNLVPVDAIRLDMTYLIHAAPNRNTRRGRKIFPRHCASSDSRHSLSRRSPTASTIVPKSVFFEVGVVGVARSKLRLNFVVIARTLIFVIHHKGDRRPCGLTLKHPRQDRYPIGFAALRGVLRLAWSPPIKIDLDISL